MSARVVVTGAGGFVGSHVTAAFVEAGHAVTALVRTRTSHRLAGARVVTCDLAEGIELPGPVDVVVHAAAALREGADHQRDNVLCSDHVLTWAAAHGARLVVLLSSTSVYGAVAGAVLDETQPCRPTDQYGRTKLTAEALARSSGTATVVLRMPGVLGRDASPGPWLVRSSSALLQDRPVVVHHPDAAFNAAVHVADVAALCVAVAASPPPSAVTANLAAAGSVTVRHAVDMLRVRLASRSPVVVEPSASSPYLIDTALAERELGYRPAHITEVLERFADDLSTEADGAPRA